MAKNLAEKYNGPFYVYDINRAALDKFVDAYPKAKAAASPADLADKASTVITMLPEATHVQQVYDAMLDAVDQESVLVDSSTIDTEVAQRVAATVMKTKNAKAFDAPVSGGEEPVVHLAFFLYLGALIISIIIIRAYAFT